MANIFSKIKDAMTGAAATVSRTPEVKKWMDDIGEALKREKNWRKEGQKVVELYEQAASALTERSDFNILYANTETLSPAVYNNTPRPVVKRRVDRENPIAIAAAQVLKATLVYLKDTGDRDEETFDDLQKTAVLEALVPGRGLSRFYYEAEFEGEGDAASVKGEEVCGESIPWNRVVFGYAKTWNKIPWRAYEHFMTREECVSNFGEVGKQIKLTHQSSLQNDDEDNDKLPADAQGVKFAHVWEIWDKNTKEVLFISDGFDKVIKRETDPLGLDGFFDSPRPVMFFQRVSSLVPQPLYIMYENQAGELEKCTRRINGLLHAMKVRGFYDGTLEGIDELLKQPENTLMPAQNVSALQQGQTLDKAIWFMPLEALIVVLQQLYAARLQIINTIHQITGIADIMRGASQASETLGAQEIKQAWGTMRLKRMQKEVQRFTRDCFRIQAEIAAKHFSIDTFKKMTGLQLPMMAEKQQAQAQMSAIQQQMQLASQQPGPDGQPQDPQAMQQQAQQQLATLQATLSKPAWEEVMQFMRSDSIRNYIIDIETNSTIDVEATEDKQELAEMMNSMSQLMNGVFPMVEQGVLPFDAAKALMLAVINKFRMGDEVEETFRAMQPPQPKQDPAMMKVQAEIQRDQQKAQIDQKRESQSAALEQQRAQAQMQQEQELAQLDMAVRRQELAFRARELQMKEQVAEAKFQRDMAMIAAKASMPPPAPAPQSGQGQGD